MIKILKNNIWINIHIEKGFDLFHENDVNLQKAVKFNEGDIIKDYDPKYLAIFKNHPEIIEIIDEKQTKTAKKSKIEAEKQTEEEVKKTQFKSFKKGN